MARSAPKAPPRRHAASRDRALLHELAPLTDALAARPEALLLARDRWEEGGVEILWANAACKALTGYSPRQLVGRNTRLLHGVKTEIGTGRWRENGEGWLHRRNGSAFYADWRFTPVRRRGAAPGFLLAVYQDLSETKRLQEALLHSQKLDTVGQLAGGVAHEFNNLLSIINGFCEILGGKLASVPAARKDLQEIHRAGLQAASLARQILEFSRRQETAASVVNANTLIREIAGILRRIVGDGVTVELRLASDLGNMRIDPTQFQQALLNLAFNARDAMPQGGKLTVRTYPAREPGGNPAAANQVAIQVADTGIGMPAAVRRWVFEPFFTTKPHGTGLGLPTVLGTVRRAGGTITLQSKAGAGTTFEMFFPETAEAEQVFSPVTLPALPVTAGSEKIWLMEADAVLRKMVAGILTADGYVVSEFAAPDEIPPAGAPELLMVDCGAATAGALAHRVQERYPRLRVLSLSVESPAAALADFPARAVAHLPKPFAMGALLRAVRGLLDAPGPTPSSRSPV